MKKFISVIEKQHPKVNLNFTIQKQQLGTANAVECGLKSLPKIGNVVLVLYGDTPLINAVKSGHQFIVRDLCDYGADIHAMNNDGMTALTIANVEGYNRIAGILCQYINIIN